MFSTYVSPKSVNFLQLLREPAEYLTSLREVADDVVNVKDPKYLSSGEVCVTLTGGYGRPRNTHPDFAADAFTF